MRYFLLLIQLLFSIIVSAQFSIQQVLSSPFPSNLTTNKAADKVAWVLNHEGIRNIWIAAGGSLVPQKVSNFTKDDGQAIGNLLFRKSDESIIFVYGGAPNRKGEIPNPTNHPDGAKRLILKINETGGTLDTLAEGYAVVLSPDEAKLAFLKSGAVWMYDFVTKKVNPAFHIRGRASSLQWSPDGNKLAFVSSRGDHGYIGVYNFKAHQIDYLSPSVDHDNNPVWSPDGQQLAFIRMPNEKSILPFEPRRTGLPWSIWVHDFGKNTTQQIWQAAKGQGSTFRAISADNQLFWTKSNQIIFPYEGNGWTNLWSVASKGGTAKNLTPGEFEVQFVALTADQQNILYSSNQGDIDRQHIWKVNAQTGDLQLLTTANGIQWSPVDLANGQVLCLASSGTMPAQVVEVFPKSVKSIIPQALLGNFPNNQLIEPEQVIFSAADGMPIHGQLFKPANMEADRKYPAVLFFHGGSRRQMLLGFHHRGYYHNAYALNQYLANQGFVVLSVNYRSGIGYGMEFREALNYGARGASEYLDVMGAGLYLRNLSEVDGDKIGLWGGSYGGYLTAMGLAKSSDLFAAGVDIHGVHDWNVVIRNFVPAYQAEKRKAFADLAYQSSPMPYVKDWKSPVLLIHGDDDRNVPFSETVDLVEALRKQDVYFEQLIFPDEVHGFLLHKNWVMAYEATADFFTRMLKK